MVHILKRYTWVYTIVLVLLLPATPATSRQAPQELTGRIQAFPAYGSGALILSSSLNFAQGDRLRILVGGSAKKILVRLLARGQSPDSSNGMVNGPLVVPANRMVEITLSAARANIIQISVHGGPNPWNFPLGAGNGPATLMTVTLIRSH